MYLLDTNICIFLIKNKNQLDTQIAAQSLARNLTVVTNNTREFSRIPGLRVEDWTKE